LYLLPFWETLLLSAQILALGMAPATVKTSASAKQKALSSTQRVTTTQNRPHGLEQTALL
jgi:hypothetical protein